MIRVQVARGLGVKSYKNSGKYSEVISKPLSTNFSGFATELQEASLVINDRPIRRMFLSLLRKDISNLPVAIKGKLLTTVADGSSVANKYSDVITYRHLQDTIAGESAINNHDSFLYKISNAMNENFWTKQS